MSTTAGYLRLVVDSIDVEKGESRVDSLGRTSQRVSGQVKIDMGQIEKAIEGLGQKVVNLDSTMSGALKNTAQNTRDQAKTFDQLRASIDPAFAASQRFKQVQSELHSIVASGNRTWEDVAPVLEMAKSRYLGVETAAERAASAQRAAELAADQSRAGYEALRASVDPLFASSKRYEAAIETLENAQRQGIISDKERAQTLELLNARMISANSGASKVTTGFQKFFKSVGGNAGQLRALPQQFGQIAQQAAVTGDVFSAVAIQAFDIGAAFGTVGVAAGAVAGFAIPAVVAAISGAKDDANETDDAISALSRSIDSLATVSQATSDDIQTYLNSAFKNVSDQVQSLIDDLRDAEFSVISKQIRDEIQSATGDLNRLGGAFQVFWSEFNNPGSVDPGYLSEIQEIIASAEIAYPAFQELETVLNRVFSAKSSQEFTAALAEARSVALEIGGPVGDQVAEALLAAAKEGGVLNRVLGEASGSSGQLSAGLSMAAREALKLAGVDIASPTSDATQEAAQLAANLGISLQAALNLQNLQSSLEYSGRGSDPRQWAEDGAAAAYQLELGYVSVDEIIQELTRSTNRLGSAGGAASTSALAGITQEISHRKTLLGLTGQERRQYEALIGVQRRLGRVAGKYNKDQLESLANQLVVLEDQEDAYKNLADLQTDLSGLVTESAFDFDRADELFKDFLERSAAQAFEQKIVLPVVGQLLGVQGLPSALGISGGSAGVAGATSGGLGFNPLGLAGNIATGGGALAGVASGFGGILSGGGLGASFANLGGLASGSIGLTAGAIGAAIPAIGVVAAAISLFRTRTKELDRGIRITVDEMDALIESFRVVEKRRFFGLSRSVSSNFSALDNSEAAPFEAAIADIQTSVLDAAETLGIGAQRFADFSHQFEVSTKDLTDEEAQAAVFEALGGFSDEFAAVALGASRVTRQGETATETLNRLSSSLVAVNDAADLLGQRQFRASITGADRASGLVDAFGGVDAYTAAVNTFYGAFYTEAERTETNIRRLTERFADLGLQLPQSRDGFRDLVTGIDLSTEAGRELYAELLQMAGALDQVLPQVGAFTAEIQGLVGGISTEIADQITASRTYANDAREAAQLWFRTATTLRDFIADLTNTDLSGIGQVQTNEINRRRFDTAFDLARGGDVDAARDIPGLARAYLQTARDQSRSSLEFRRISAGVQDQINFLAGIAELEGANEDILQTLYNRQIDVLTDLGQFLSLEGLTDAQVAELSDGVQALHADWGGTVTAFENSLGELERAIVEAEAFSYDDLVGRLDIAVSLADNAPRWVQRLVDRADTGLRTSLDFIVRNNQLTPDLRYIAVNSVSQHVNSIDFVLRRDLDRQTRQIVLRNTDTLTRNLRLGVTRDLDADTRRLVLTGTQNLSREMNLILGRDLDADTRRLALTQNARLTRTLGLALTSQASRTIGEITQLSNLIDGSGRISLGGGVEFEPAEAFSTLFDGLSRSTRDLVRPLDSLRSPLDALRAAVDADRQSRERAAQVQVLQNTGARISERRENRAQGIIDDIKALEDSTGITLLRSGDRDAILNLRNNGTIAYRADYTTGGAGLNDFNRDFRGSNGLEASIFASNSQALDEGERLQALRRQIRALGEIPAFANGTNFAPGGLSLVGELGPELVNLPRGSQVHTASQTRSMLANDPEVKALLRKIVEEVSGHRDENAQASRKIYKEVKNMSGNSDLTVQFGTKIDGPVQISEGA